MKQILVFADERQGWVLTSLLREHWEGAADYSVRHLPYWRDEPAPNPDTVAVVLAQVGHSVHAEHRLRRLCRPLPADVRVVRFPVLQCPVLWPFALRVSKPWIEPGRAAPRFRWGDRCVIDLVQSGMPADEALQRYLELDVARAVGIARIFDRWVDGFRQVEAMADVAILDVVLYAYWRRRTFVAHDDVESFVLHELLNRTLAVQNLPKLQVSADALPKRVPQSEIPIHPSLIKHFGLEYVNPSSTYAMPWGVRLTHGDWVQAYIDHLLAEREHARAATPA